MSVGADSNGSGVVALMELLAIMKKFYEKPSTRPNYHMVSTFRCSLSLDCIVLRTFFSGLR